MKKSIAALIVLFLLICLSGCEQPEQSSLSHSSSAIPQKGLLITEVPYADNWVSTNLSSICSDNVSVKAKEKWVPDADHSELRYVYLLSTVGDESDYHYSYLAAETPSKILFSDLTTDDAGSYADSLQLCDIDGDKIDEIILQQTVGMTGGAGQYLSRVFKADGNKIREMFSSSPSEDRFDTGYTSECLDGYKLRIKNSFTGYSKIIDISKKYTADFFDENGKGKSDKGIICDSFFKFEPCDTDNDGVFEIKAEQYVSLDGHADAVGNAQSILKYNNDTQKFEVIKAEFNC